jgi:hypothetical protein
MDHTFEEADLEPSLRSDDRTAELNRILHHTGDIPAGHDRLAALAQHVVEASGSHDGNTLSMEQTLDQQQQQQAVAAVDLLSFAGEPGPGYSENYNLEGFLGQQQAEARRALEEDGSNRFDDVGGSGYHLDDSLNGAMYNPDLGAGTGEDGGEGDEMDKSMITDGGDDEHGHVGGTRKRRRKMQPGEDSVKAKKEIHVSVVTLYLGNLLPLTSPPKFLTPRLERSRTPS